MLEYRQFAHDLLVLFVHESADIYGPEFLVYNVHSLTHLKSEVDEFGSLDNSSAFVFENYTQHLKRFIRNGRNPVVQIANRLGEEDAVITTTTSYPIPVTEPYSLEVYGCKSPDNYCVLLDGRCCQIVSIGLQEATCMVFTDSEPLYLHPCDSRQIGVHRVLLSNGSLKSMPASTLAYKALCFPDSCHGQLVFMQLLHVSV